MKKLDVRKIIEGMRETVKSHELSAPGEYCRYLWQDKEGTRKMGINEYGCADALNILYTINDFTTDAATRAARISALQSMQDKESGMFREPTHHTIHTTAHCTAALELMDARPLYPVRGLHQYMGREELFEFLDTLDWNEPWGQSHKGAGIYAALVNSGEITEDFQKNYFEWMWENADPVTGLWKSGYADRAPITTVQVPNGTDNPSAIYAYMAGSFHYLFNHEYAKQPLRYPEKMIDCCIDMYKKGGMRDDFAKRIGFLEIDWVYCMNRASRQTTHRYGEVKELLYEFAEGFIDYLGSLDYKTHDRWNDLHMLFGTACALAELQTALPGVIITEKPLRLVLDRRPFI